MAAGPAQAAAIVLFAELRDDALFGLGGQLLRGVHPSAHLGDAVSLHLLQRFVPFPRFGVHVYARSQRWNLAWRAPGCSAGDRARRMLPDALVDVGRLADVHHAVGISKHVHPAAGERFAVDGASCEAAADGVAIPSAPQAAHLFLHLRSFFTLF